MSYDYKFVTQFIPSLFEPSEHEVVRLPSLDNRVALNSVNLEADKLYVEAEHRLNSELGSLFLSQTSKGFDPKELNEVKAKRKLKQARLIALQTKLSEFEADSSVHSTDNVKELSLAIKATAQRTQEVELESLKYAYVKNRTAALVQLRANQTIALQEQTKQIQLRLDQAHRLYTENDVAAKALLERMHSYQAMTQHTQASRLLKLKLRLVEADEVRSSLEKAKKEQIQKMMPTKQQMALQKKLNHKILHAKKMEAVMMQAKLVKE